MSELSIVILCLGVLSLVVFIVVFWKLGKDIGGVGKDIGGVGKDIGGVGKDIGGVGKDIGRLGKDVSRKKHLYLDCLSWYKKNPREITSKDVDECRKLLEKKSKPLPSTPLDLFV